MWSPWKWVTSTALIEAGSMPAARMLAASWPVVGGPLSAKPESMM